MAVRPASHDGEVRQISVAVPIALADALHELARREDRSLAGEMRRALNAHVERYAPSAPAPALKSSRKRQRAAA